MRPIRPVLICILTALTALPAAALSPIDEQAIKMRIDRAGGGNFGCTDMRKLFRVLRKDYPEVTFAFAGRRAPTITGMRGCGWSFDVDPATARQKAMTSCKREEAKRGTGPNGTRICRLLAD